MIRAIPNHERRLWLAVSALCALGVMGHFAYPLTPDVVKNLVAQFGLHANLGGNHFVDNREFFGIPNAADVLSNLPFAIFGIWGLLLQANIHKTSHPYVGRESFVLTLFFIGLIFTAMGSMLYHLAPSDNSLLWDRAGMAFAFAGMLGVAASERISAKSGIWLGLASLLIGALTLLMWSKTSDVLPWMLLQLGSMILILVLAITRKNAKGLGVSLYAIIIFYAIAKICEANDHMLYEATGHVVSGHTLKHLVASLAAWPVIRVIR